MPEKQWSALDHGKLTSTGLDLRPVFIENMEGR